MRREEAAQMLGCELKSTPEEIRKRYRVLSMKMHPDRPGGSEEKFVQLNQAYEVLTQTEERDMITKNMFDRFRAMYAGSEEEKTELIDLYKKHKGQMAKIIDSLLLGEDEQEERYRKILDAEIEEKKIPEFPKYKAKLLILNKKRQAKRQREREAAEVLAKDMEERASARKERYNRMIERLEETVSKAPARKKKGDK
ncbi:DnaJ-like protein subfamily C member 9 [Nematocida minor]|uniref:DnaJ-like protein subfamily C member 9 n=1 Tax=Nematocida minor TaxID=1912983 RepID=UPI00221FBAA4|nr:DnaJ-like protein subfamily C member 9 [Nematocida minor]XP_051332033.1 DnaJ-like protein subfamily C member 9 [Nematocida minor]KAI5188763.1 DnaJ-like protein subfamily C member 9 [Nematocida minor]KAI5188867.1 DnaJ-like protein subfamily C member 9 [Nematocida minor]